MSSRAFPQPHLGDYEKQCGGSPPTRRCSVAAAACLLYNILVMVMRGSKHDGGRTDGRRAAAPPRHGTTLCRVAACLHESVAVSGGSLEGRRAAGGSRSFARQSRPAQTRFPKSQLKHVLPRECARISAKTQISEREHTHITLVATAAFPDIRSESGIRKERTDIDDSRSSVHSSLIGQFICNPPLTQSQHHRAKKPAGHSACKKVGSVVK